MVLMFSAKLHYDLPNRHPSVFCDEHINFRATKISPAWHCIQCQAHYDLPNHRPSVFCDEHINFVLVAFHGDRTIPIAIFEAFHPV
jgi:hypothetical protein